MTEKKPREFWRVFRSGCRLLFAFIRWTAIAVFSVLFSVGLALHLPAKVLILPALIPAVAILVPRAYQKWCWAAMAAAAAAVWGWIHLPLTGEEEWKTYAFQVEPMEEIPDNAAGRYEQLVEQTKESIFTYPYTEQEDQLSYGGAWKPEEFPSLDQWMERWEPLLETVMEISRMPVCRFEVPGDPVRYERQQLRLKMMKAWCSMLIRSANRDLGMGRNESALEKQLTIVRIAGHLYQQGTLLDQAVGYYLEDVAARVLARMIVEKCTEPMLEQVEETLRQVQPRWNENWPRILEREKLLARNIAAIFYQADSKGRTRLSRDVGLGLHDVLGYPHVRLFESEKVIRLAVLVMWLTMPASPAEAAAMIDERYDRYARLAEQGQDLEFVDTLPLWRRGLHCRSLVDWYAKRQVSFYYPLKRRDAQHKALREATALLIELRRYYLKEGRWPEQLEELAENGLPAEHLTDPLRGERFVYRRTQNGFVLYSVGANGRDDGGVQDPWQGKDDRLYWPTPDADSAFGSGRVVQEQSGEPPAG